MRESPNGSGRRALAVRLALAFLGLACGGCGRTDDVIGINNPTVVGGSSGSGGAAGAGGAGGGGDGSGAQPGVIRAYPNLFAELLGKTEPEISRKLDADYAQLFHGDPNTQAIFVPVGTDQAYVWDPREGAVIADGYSWAMLISVELNRREEFDKLWRWADAHSISKTGPLRGYLRSQCTLTGDSCELTVQAAPHFDFITALLLADGRWGSTSGIDYAAAAGEMLEACFRVEPGAQTALGELSGLIDLERLLPRETPYVDATSARTSAMEAAYFELWSEKTGDLRTATLAANARQYWASVADEGTGLVPDRASFDGLGDAGADDFTASSYTLPLAVALDAIWHGKTLWHTTESDALLTFFREPLSAGMFATSYSTAGAAGGTTGDLLSLKAPIAATSVAATVDFRTEFVDAVWNARLDTGTSRKFGNLLYLQSALVLSGRFRVY